MNPELVRAIGDMIDASERAVARLRTNGAQSDQVAADYLIEAAANLKIAYTQEIRPV